MYESLIYFLIIVTLAEITVNNIVSVTEGSCTEQFTDDCFITKNTVFTIVRGSLLDFVQSSHHVRI